MIDATQEGVDVGFVEPMLRRRLSTLARMTLRVAADCVDGAPDLRVVFASRHGELVRTTQMLEQLARREELSPTSFGMSVLNAGVGLLSILWKNTAPSTAVSSGEETFGYGLIEAVSQARSDPARPVLFIYADEELPAIYHGRVHADTNRVAVAMLLDAAACCRVTCVVEPAAGRISEESQVSAFLRSLSEGESCWQGEEKRWRWTRTDACSPE